MCLCGDSQCPICGSLQGTLDGIVCPACKGSGEGKQAGPDTPFCKVCQGEGTISQEEWDNVMDGTAEFREDDKGDWLYEQWKDKQ